MKITRVGYSALFNLGNYNNERIELTAQLDENDDISSVVQDLRTRANSLALPNEQILMEQIQKRRHLLEELEKRIASRTEEWNAIADFLKAQGIKPDALNMPDFKKLLPQAYSETSEVIEGEVTDDF